MENKLTEKYFNNWLNEDRSVIPFPNLMKELLDYGIEHNAKLIKIKAQHTYAKCLRAKKFELANKIANKYKLNEIKSDVVMAMSISAWALKNKSDGK